MQQKVLIQKDLYQEIEALLRKYNIKWKNMEITETSDGFLVLVRTPYISDYTKAAELSYLLETDFKDPLVSISIIPTPSD